MPSGLFDYSTAFSRNIGWVTAAEQRILRGKRVAIAGLGGVGGSHLNTLARLGIGAFNLADYDTFELANLNRQAGSSLSTLGEPKTDVMSARALDINPELDLRLFPDGVNKDNVEEFLGDADLYLDGLDFFAINARRLVFDTCTRLEIPSVTAAPLGLGVALLNFLPGRMNFEEYFQLENQKEEEQLLRFLLGLSPAMLQARYLVEPTAVRLAEHRGPSTPMACDLCAGVAGTQVLKILLGRGKVVCAPHGLQFDAYRNRLVRTWRPGGNRNPVQKLGLFIARQRFGSESRAKAQSITPPPEISLTVTEKILDKARWAPSGDNSQPWKFELLDPLCFAVHGSDTREDCIYDLTGDASHLSLGTLLETIAIAATEYGLHAEFTPGPGSSEDKPVFHVRLKEDAEIKPSPLLPFIAQRTVQRRPLSTSPLSEKSRRQLEAAAGSNFRIHWFASFQDRFRLARLLYRNGGLRLTLPEAFETHRSVIQWDTDLSEDRIPARAVGLDPVTTHLMKWAMKSWERVNFLNRYMAGTLIPRIELDFVPAIACAAHFVLTAPAPPRTMEDYVAAGRSVQRFWLTATRLNLQLQPELTPLIFRKYIRTGVDFSSNTRSRKLARDVAEQLEQVLRNENAACAVFMGRIGMGETARSRSTRKPLEKLLLTHGDRTGAQSSGTHG